MNASKLIAIIGPTASGKSNLAHTLAKQIDGEIISCDSVLVYKGFDIGSAKPTRTELEEIPYHLIDTVSCHEPFDAALYRKEALATIEDIQGRSKTALIVGGTGLYFRALCGSQFHMLPSNSELRNELEEYDTSTLYELLQTHDPLRATELHPNDRFRLLRACEIAITSGKTMESLTSRKDFDELRPRTILCTPPSEELEKRIRLRTQKMLEDGLVEEVANLLRKGCRTDSKVMQSIGYLQTCAFLEGKLTKDQLRPAIITATRQYARKQRKWFRKVPRDLELTNPYDVEESISLIQNMLQL